MRIINLFKAKSDPRLEKLREAVELNRADSAWVAAFRNRVEALALEVRSARQELSANPSDRAAQDFISAHTAWEIAAKTLPLIGPAVHPTLQLRKLERTRPALQAALECVRERLLRELDTVAIEDRAAAEKFGLDESATASPIREKIQQAIRTAESFLARLESLDVDQYHGPIEFCLGPGY